MIPSYSLGLRHALAWLVLLLAAGSYVALAVAEQGAAPAGFETPPSQPLPFARQRVFGLDLSDRSSVDALNWLNAAGNPSLALTVVALDPDVVGALVDTEQQPLAYSALDLLLGAGGATPLAVCLHEPPGTVGQLGIAQAAIGALNDRYTARIAYVAGCAADSLEWRRAVVRAALKTEQSVTTLDNALVPLSAGATLSVTQTGNDSMQRAALRAGSSGNYAVLRESAHTDVSARLVSQASAILQDNAQIALVLVVPSQQADPGRFVAGFASAQLPTDTAPQGFSPIDTGSLQLSGEWQPSQVGAVTYRLAQSEGAALTIDFVGADIYLTGLVAPDNGAVDVWLDPPDGTLPPPNSSVSFEAAQARDVATPLYTGLPATRHRIVVVSSGGKIALSGVFIAGRATPGWANGVAAAGLLAASVAALTMICFSAVQGVRTQGSPVTRRRSEEHPRGFSLRG